ncbi:MAG: hypothetical protein O3B92_03225, partial [Actinobacteria bacterium]|nr:hypothetical protein [Actinomycetota bacterium]
MSKSVSKISIFVLAGFLGFTGISHFLVPASFNALVPEWLSGNSSFYTYISGLAEILIAIFLLKPSTRRRAAWAAVVLFN